MTSAPPEECDHLFSVTLVWDDGESVHCYHCQEELQQHTQAEIK